MRRTNARSVRGGVILRSYMAQVTQRVGATLRGRPKQTGPMTPPPKRISAEGWDITCCDPTFATNISKTSVAKTKVPLNH